MHRVKCNLSEVTGLWRLYRGLADCAHEHIVRDLGEVLFCSHLASLADQLSQRATCNIQTARLNHDQNSQSLPCQISLLTPRAHCRHQDGSEKLCSQRGDSCGREGGAAAGIGGRDRYDHAESLHDPTGSNPQSRRTRVLTYCR